MWVLLIFGFPVLEIYLLFKVGDVIGLANTFFYLLASAVLGIGLIRTQGAYLMRNVQTSLTQGHVPEKSLIHSLLIFLSGALFIFPGYISSFIALLLLLPGSRHVIAFFMRKKLAQKLREGSVHFSAGGFGPGGFSASFGRFHGFRSGSETSQPMRDVSPMEIDSRSSRDVEVDVIDITPIKKSDQD